MLVETRPVGTYHLGGFNVSQFSNIKSVDDCKAACVADSACRQLTFVNRPTDPCVLYHSVDAVVSQMANVRAFVKCPAGSTDPKCATPVPPGPRPLPASFELALVGLMASTEYMTIFRYNFSVAERRIMSGAALSRLHVTLVEEPGSLLLEYTPMKTDDVETPRTLPAVRATGAASSCSFTQHSYNGKSLGGRPVAPADNQTQCCEICQTLPACEAAGLDPKAGRCYPVANVSGWVIDHRYTGCVPRSRTPASQTFTFAAADTLALSFDADTLALRNVTVTVDGVRQGLLHSDDPWQSGTGFPLWRLNVSDCASPVEYPLTAISGRAATTTSHAVVAGVLVLQWVGVPLPEPLNGTVDVEVTATPRPNGKGLALRGAVSQSRGAHGLSSVCSHAFALPSLDSMVFRSHKHEQLFVPSLFGHVGQCHGNHMQCTMAKLGGRSGSMSPGGNPEWMHHTGGGISPEHMFMPNGASRSMQYYALLSNFTGASVGLYIGAHDPQSRLQLMLLEGLYADEQGCTNASTLAEGSPTACGRAALQWHHFPERMKVDLSAGGSYSMPYDVVIEGFRGDWFSASQIYRAWVVESAVWTRQGTLKQRVAKGQYPQWLLDTHLWVAEQKSGKGTVADPRKGGPAFIGANPDDPLRWDQATNTSIPPATVTTLKAIRSILGSDICAEWSGYDTGAFDTKDGPDGWIPRPGFAAAVKEAQAAGVRIIPYTNGRIDDPSVPSFKSDGAIRYMCNGTAGPYREEFNAYPRNVSFFVPDPGALYWQQQMGRVAYSLAVNYGTDGLYVDQYASMWAQPCNGQGGSHWGDGVRAVFETQRAMMGKDKIVISESNGEAYIGSLHANLALYGWFTCGFVPAFQSI